MKQKLLALLAVHFITLPKKLPALIAATLLLTFLGCSEDVYETDAHVSHEGHKNEISFKKFKEQTGIRDFSTLKSFSTGSGDSREISSDYLIDTLAVMYFASPVGKDTYAFKIYPLIGQLLPDEYYNLVYEKNGEQWNELIFKNKENKNVLPGEPKLQSSQMIYNRGSFANPTLSDHCSIIQYEFHCTRTGSCRNGVCDGCSLCVSVSVSYVPCSGGGDGSTGPGTIVIGPGDGISGNSSGVYIPNPYDGEEDMANPSFVFAMEVAAFTRTLPASLKNTISSRAWIYPKIVDFMRNSGGLSQANKDAAVFALSNFPLVSSIAPPNMASAHIEMMHYNAFSFLLENPNQDSVAFIQKVAAMGSNLGQVDFTYKIIKKASFVENECLNGTYDEFQNSSSSFNYFIQQLDSSLSLADVTLSAGPFDAGDGKFALTTAQANSLIDIKFNTNLLNRPKLSIARTMVHEFIHALIFQRLLKISSIEGETLLGLSPAEVLQMKDDYYELWLNYTRYELGIPENGIVSDFQHQYMADKYRTVIAAALKEYDSNAHPQSFYDALAWEGLMGKALPGQSFNDLTGLYPLSTVAWLAVPQASRLAIVNTIRTFDNSNPSNPCN